MSSPKIVRLGFFAVCCALVLASPASAKIKGTVCGDCHTMHNSQGNKVVFKDPADASNKGPVANCLNTGCVGCHSNPDGKETIVTKGGQDCPIVFNPNHEPTTYLAGGNFYWVRKDGGNDRCGHNVLGISDKDSVDPAPGAQPSPCSVAPGESCHRSLFEPILDWQDYFSTGCQGCHLRTSHHQDTGMYRYLRGHNALHTEGDPLNPDAYVTGYGDPKWEHNATEKVHNEYHGLLHSWPGDPGYDPKEALADSYVGYFHSIDSFCLGCHGQFKGTTADSSTHIWLRHPTGRKLPAKGEEKYEPYVGRFGENKYDPLVPVGRLWKTFTGPSEDVVLGSDVTMCISCHRPHGSPWPSMLRWKYNKTDEVEATGTCRTCHSKVK
ncbi:MAG: cytochrome c3 family protein [Pseudomonadota bacterium]